MVSAKVMAAVLVAIVALPGCARGATPAPTPSPTTSAASRPTATTAVLDLYAGTVPAADPEGTASTGSVRTPDGRERTYRLFVPAGLPGPAPLLVALHGGLGSGEQFATNSGFDGLATSNGFVVVYPDGIGNLPGGGGGIRTWNGGDCCGPAARLQVDDVAFVELLVRRVAATQKVDKARVFASGHSNGAILALRLACEASDTFAAVGVQAAALGVDRCAPTRPVSVMMIHGEDDRNIPIDGGLGAGLSRVTFTSPRQGAKRLAAADGCGSEPTATIDSANPDLTLSRWPGCPSGVAVQFLAVAGAGHAWMGHEAASPAAQRLVGPPYPDLDSSRAIWAFVSTHPRA